VTKTCSMLVEAGCIPAMDRMLSGHDPRVQTVALEGINNILNAAKSDEEFYSMLFHIVYACVGSLINMY